MQKSVLYTYKNKLTVPKIKHLNKIKKKQGGRNNKGHICIRHRGGGNKKYLRLINFQENFNETSFIVTIIKDPCRSANIGLAYYTLSNLLYYTIIPNGLKQGDILSESYLSPICEKQILLEITPLNGFSYNLYQLPLGTIVCNINTKPNQRKNLVRSAGCFAVIFKHTVRNEKIHFTFLKVPSGKIVCLNALNSATIGIVSNINHNKLKLTKAGANRWLGIRPSVRGIAMNPVDHPHGGRTNGGRPSVSPWGRLAKGKKTAKKHV